MWSWKKSQTTTWPEPMEALEQAGRPAGLPPDEGAALDALAALLRTLGEYGFDLDRQDAASFRHACDAWARHLLIVSQPPEAARQQAAAAPGERDWLGLRQFVAARRRDEQQYVFKTLNDLRQVIWTFVQGLQTAFAEDEQTDDRLLSQFERLRTVDGRDTEEIKREVASTVATLTGLVEEHKRIHQMRVEHLAARVAELGGQLKVARHDSTIDPLTRAFNRRAAEEQLSRTVYLRDAFGQSACLLLADLDNLKILNDTHGHQAGDAALKAFADCLVRSFPRRTDTVARFGGDEFVVIMPETSLQDGVRLTERLMRLVRATEVSHEGVFLRLTTSVGISELGWSETLSSWFNRTDQALYRAKQTGRDQFVEAVGPGPSEIERR
ncbi:MAG: GGDEF domain-containing protein [Chloroflexi bacterium]|nr:GGDEF domain-containing protein [Chloroflexota bacterium]